MAGHDRSAGSHALRFPLPGLRATRRTPRRPAAGARLAALLPVEVLEIPGEALEERSGPALTYDDLIDLMLSLDAADVLPVG